MSKRRRDNVFIWPTWITKLISGEKQCEYASWFRAHYTYDKKLSSFDLVKWNIKHNQLLLRRRDELEKQGYTVKIEDQNSFKLQFSLTSPGEHPHDVTISGKADIVVLGNSGQGIVEDCKTGHPKNSDQVQVMLYMMFLPVAVEEYKDIVFSGNVIYTNDKVPIVWTDIDTTMKEVVWNLMKRIGGGKPCRKVPSYSECKWCDIPKEDCPEKIE